MQHDAKKEETEKKAFDGIACQWQIHGRQCEEVKTDPEETKEEYLVFSRGKGDQQFTQDERGTEITIDLVLQARAKMLDNKVNGPEDAVVSEMIKQLPRENPHHRNVFPGTCCYENQTRNQRKEKEVTGLLR